ncbi:PREDICTED: uncharacterized protein LOC101306912 [Fragaria vesca subsp. vesca]
MDPEQMKLLFLGTFAIIISAMKIPFRNPNFITFTLITSIPLFFITLLPQLPLVQDQIIDFSIEVLVKRKIVTYSSIETTQEDLSWPEELTIQFLKMYIVDMVNFLTAFTTIYASSTIHTSIGDHKASMSVTDLLKNSITKSRWRDAVFMFIAMSMLHSVCLPYVFYAIHVQPAVTFAIWVEYNAWWKLSVVVSILELQQRGFQAFSTSSQLIKGDKLRGFVLMLLLLYDLARSFSTIKTVRAVEVEPPIPKVYIGDLINFLTALATICASSTIHTTSDGDHKASMGLRHLLRNTITRSLGRDGVFTFIAMSMLHHICLPYVAYCIHVQQLHLSSFTDSLIFKSVHVMVPAVTFAIWVEYNAWWKLSVVASILQLEEQRGLFRAFSTSSQLMKGDKLRGFVLMLLLKSLDWPTTRAPSSNLPIFRGHSLFKCTNFAHVFLQASLLCLGKVMTWMVFTVYYFDSSELVKGLDMESNHIMLKPKIGVFDILKESLYLICKSHTFIILTFLTSLPFFCFSIYYELHLQRTLVQILQFLKQNSDFFNYNWQTQLHTTTSWTQMLSNNLIQLGLLYLIPLHLLEHCSAFVIVDLASKLEGKGKFREVSGSDSVTRAVRFRGTLVTSIWAACMALLANYLEWGAIWNMSIVISILENTKGANALTLSAYLSRGRERRQGLVLTLIFGVWGIGLKLTCLFFKHYERRGGIVAQIGLICTGNVVKWVAYMIYYQYCKKLISEKRVDVEIGQVVEK